MPSPRRFFIIGSARTGTTLLRLVVESHSQIACFDEWRSYIALATNEYDAPDASLLGFKIPAWTELLTEPFVTDPLTNEPTVSQFYRSEPCIFMLRDVREVVASMFTVGLLEQLNDTVRAKIEHREDFRERFRAELASVERSPHPDLALGALYWKEKTVAIFDYDRIGVPVLGVRYEDLTSDPQGQLRRIVRFLDVPWEQGLLDHPSHPHGELDSDGMAIAMTDPKRSIDRASVRSWERTFGPEQLAAIMAVAGDTNQRIHADHVVDGDLRRILDAYVSASGVA